MIGQEQAAACQCGDPECRYNNVDSKPPIISGWVSKNGQRLELDSLENILAVLEWLETALWLTRPVRVKAEVWWFP